MISPIRCPYAPSLLLPVVCRQIALDFFSLKGSKKVGKRQQKGSNSVTAAEGQQRQKGSLKGDNRLIIG